MLRVTIPAKPPTEWWNPVCEEFVKLPGSKEQVLQLEHSLVSLSKWESKWCKPFITRGQLTDEETIDYIRCMTLTQNVPPEVYDNIPDNIIEQISSYIDAPMTATTVSDSALGGKKSGSETVTSELIYYWMIALNIPMECQKWHLNRLLMLIKVCNVKNAPPKKMGKRATINHYAALNEARRNKLNSKG